MQFTLILILIPAENIRQPINPPITDISFEVGFGDSSSFFRAFKAKNGISPSEYRARRFREPNR